MRSLSLKEPKHRGASDMQEQAPAKSNGKVELKELNLTGGSGRFMQTQRSKHDHEQCVHHADNFNKTASKLHSTNFDHHDESNCVCSDCHCGRHLCKFNVIKPDLTKNTVYQKSFYQQKAIPNVVNHDKEYDRLQGPHLEMSSTYIEGFKGRGGDRLERPVPEDLLKSSGPCPQLSSYSSQFPGYKGENQYIKPTDRHTRGYFPLRSKSTYSNHFVAKDAAKDDYTYFPDQLRTKSNWFGRTTYENFYSNPNPEYFAKKVKIIEKLQANPDYSRQYCTSLLTLETVYKNDFIPKENPLCPSKIHLETKAQGHFL